VIYVAFGSNSYYLYAFYKSTDGGNSWTQLNVPEYLCGQGFYNHALIVKPNDPNTILAGGVHNYGSSCQYGIIKSTDGGSSWSEVAGQIVHPDIHHFAYGPDGTLYVATDGGIWKSYNDGNTWININKGLGTLQFYTLAIKPNDEWIITGGTKIMEHQFYITYQFGRKLVVVMEVLQFLNYKILITFGQVIYICGILGNIN